MSKDNWRDVWRTLTVPRSADADEARREYMTKVISLLMGIVAFGLALIFGGGWALGVLPLDSLLITLVMTLIFGGGWWLSYREHWRIAGYIPPIVIFLTAVYGNCIGGSGAPAMVLYALAIALTATLQSERAQWITLVLSVSVYAGIGWAQIFGYITQLRSPETAFANRVVIVAGVYTGLAFLLWFLVGQFRYALVQSWAFAERVAMTNRQMEQEIVEHKQAEQAMRQSEEKYRKLIETTDTGFVIINDEGNVLDANPRYVSLTGHHALEEILGHNVLEWTAEYAKAQNLAAMQLCLARGFIRNLEIDYIDEKGQATPIELNATIVQTDAGLQILTLCRDITERKQAEAQLKRNLRETRVRFEVSQALAGKETEDEVLDALIQHAGLYLQAHVSILTFDRTGSELAVSLRRCDTFESGLIDTVPTGMRFPASSFTSINLFHLDQPFISNDVLADERVDPATRELFRPGRVASYAIFPLTAGNEWMGYIGVTTKLAGYFDEEKLPLYQALAERGAVALRAARLRETISESQQRLSLLVQQSPLAVIEWNTDLQVVSWNPAAERTFGYTSEEALGRHAMSLIVPEAAQPPIDQVWQALLAQKGGTHSTNDNVTKDGRLITCEWFNVPLVGADGQVIGVASLVENITQRKRAEQVQAATYRISEAAPAAQNQEALFRSIHAIVGELMPAKNFYIALYDASADLFTVPFVVDESGFPPPPYKSGKGLNAYVLRTGKPLLATPEIFEQLVQSGQVESIGRLSVDWLGVPLKTQRGTIGVMAVQTYTEAARLGEADKDVLVFVSTQVAMAIERKRTEEEIEQLNQDLERRATELAALNAASRALSSTLDLDRLLELIIGRVKSLLDAEAASVLLHAPMEGGAGDQPGASSAELVFAASAGPGSEQLVGTRLPVTAGIAGWVMRERQPALVADVQNDLRFYNRIDAATGITTRSLLAVPLVFQDKTLGVVEAVNKVPVSGHSTFDEHNLATLQALASSAAIAIENARLYQAEREAFRRLQDSQAQLVQSEKMAALGRLVASIAHEINNPLQAMQNSIELAEEELESGLRREKLARYLGMALSEIQRLATIVRRLRDFYRPVRQEMQPTDVHAILRDVLELIGKQLQHSQITVEQEVYNLPLIQANPDHLKQVFLNLVLNALDAMSMQGGVLSVRTAPDHIPGSDNRPLPAVRIEFTDTGDGIPAEILPHIFEPFVTTKKTGTGLGLSITYGLIEAHNGRITVASQVGEGTTFTVLLPVGEI